MKIERAIELLNRISECQFDGIHGDERREALEMAVKALEGDGDTISRKAVMKEFADFVRKSNNSDFAPTPTWNDAVSLVGSMPPAQPTQTNADSTHENTLDCVSRQAAIDACCFGITHARAINVETGAVVDLFAESNKELHKAIERIEALPSAQTMTCDGCKYANHPTGWSDVCVLCIRNFRNFTDRYESDD